MRTTVEIKKLHLIEEFLKIQNEDVLNKIEFIMKEDRLKTLETELKRPFTDSEFNKMIDRAEKDASEGKVFTSKDTKDQVRSWK